MSALPEVKLSGPHRRLLVGLAVAFALLVSLRLHQFSFPFWYELLDISPQGTLLLGQAREIRSDDWMLDLPWALAQLAHDPKLPIINSNLGTGQNMLLPLKAPVGGFQLLFRPSMWGFVFGPDVGMAWDWWSMTFGLFYAFFLLFMVLTGNRFDLSVGGGLIVLFSPFFQYWSLHKAPIALHMALLFVGLVIVFFSQRRYLIVLAGLLVGWSAACYALEHLYPPFQVSVGYLLLVVLVCLFWEKRQSCFRGHTQIRYFALACAALITGIALFDFYEKAGDAIQKISQTTYPGLRFSTGGGLALNRFFADDFLAHGLVRDWTKMGNLCEGSSFFLLAPLLFFLTLWAKVRHRFKIGLFLGSLFAFEAFLFIYSIYGIPEWLAKSTLLGRLTANRTGLAVGLCDTLILFIVLLRLPPLDLSTKTKLFLAGIWSLVVLVFVVQWNFPFKPFAIPLEPILALLHGGVAYLAFSDRRLKLIPLLAVFSVLYTFTFNPLVRGGTTPLFEHPLSKKIVEIDRLSGKKSNWVCVDSPGGEKERAFIFANLFRMLGVHSPGGYQGSPMLDLWRRIDPIGKYEKNYNQSNYVNFYLSDETQELFPASSRAVIVNIPPNSVFWDRLGIDFVLVLGSSSQLEKAGRLQKVYQDPGERFEVYRVKHAGAKGT